MAGLGQRPRPQPSPLSPRARCRSALQALSHHPVVSLTPPPVLTPPKPAPSAEIGRDAPFICSISIPSVPASKHSSAAAIVSLPAPLDRELCKGKGWLPPTQSWGVNGTERMSVKSVSSEFRMTVVVSQRTFRSSPDATVWCVPCGDTSVCGFAPPDTFR